MTCGKYPRQIRNFKKDQRRSGILPVSPGRRGDQVEKWYYRSVFDDLEDIRNFNKWLIRQIEGTSPAALLPAPGEPVSGMLPEQPAVRPPEVSEKDEEVVVTLETFGGIMKKDIDIHLIDSRTLEITFERAEEWTEKGHEHFLHERSFASAVRILSLPAAVVSSGSSASFRDGILEVRLMKDTDKNRIKILID